MKAQGNLPYHVFYTPNELEVWVGKNRHANDLLTFTLSHPRDLWFHVANASGPHVLLRHDPLNPPSEEDINYASFYAVKYAKKKCLEVHYAECIHVKRPRHGRAGEVILEDYQTLILSGSALKTIE